MKADVVGIGRQVMGKVNGLSPAYQGLLLVAVVLCALSVVTSQHKARKLFNELQQEQERAKQLDVEWGQLQLEQSTWAMHARVEKIARDRLHMSVPDAKRTQVVMPAEPSPEARR
jgi:cell division protein FtsL